MAFGTGSAMAHRAVDAVMGPRTIQHETVVSEAAAAPAPANSMGGSDACNMHMKAFQDVCNIYININKLFFYFEVDVDLHVLFLCSVLTAMAVTLASANFTWTC